MDNQYVAQAQAAYQGTRLSGRKPGIRPAAQDPSVPKGPAIWGICGHQLGNCLLQLKDFDSAIESYTRRPPIPLYDAVGAVNCNLGKAYVFKPRLRKRRVSFEIATL